MVTKTRLNLASVNHFTFLLAALVSLAMPITPQNMPPNGRWGPGSVFPPDQNPRFFPAGTFDPNDDLLERTESWYLRSLGEQPLFSSAADRSKNVYRVLVCPAFSSPVVARLTVTPNSSAELETKISMSDLKPEILVTNQKREVTAEDVRTFVRLLDGANFWSTRNVQRDPRQHVFGGTSWLLEASVAGKYHVTCWIEPSRVPCSDAASFLIVNLGSVDLRRLPTHLHDR
jgi:hypothetical protein